MGNCILKIKTINQFFEDYGKKLIIPAYQRNYTWSKTTALTLLKDVNFARNKFNRRNVDNVDEASFNYRIGTIILNNEDDKFNIVDGLQRITTILLILQCLHNKFVECKNIDSSIEEVLQMLEFNALSFNRIIDNSNEISKKLENIDEIDKFYSFFLNHCEVVIVECSDLSESFQLFDSQNSRGKSLAPHDILKAFHLRCWNDDANKKDLIIKWNDICNKSNDDKNNDSINIDLKSIFEWYLYPIKRWNKEKTGLNYSIKDIDNFKGIDITDNTNEYNYIRYLKNNDFKNDIYQITEQFISGKCFFEYVSHYYKLLINIKDKVFSLKSDEYKIISESLNILQNKGKGDIYTIKLWLCLLLLICDRFNENELFNVKNKNLLLTTFKWACAIRLYMPTSVYKETINNYALGNHNINKYNLFYKVTECNDITELLDISITLGDRKKSEIKKSYKSIYNLLFKENV